MSTLTLAGTELEVDADGFLSNHEEWSEEIANDLAKLEGIEELTPRHFNVINFMRKEFVEQGTGPSIRRLKNAGGIPTKELYQLFPGGPAKKAARIAGIPKPQGCI